MCGGLATDMVTCVTDDQMSHKHGNDQLVLDEFFDETKRLKQDIQAIPLLFPWTQIDLTNTMLCRKIDETKWNEALREELVNEILHIYLVLLQDNIAMNAHSMINNASNLTRFHGRLLVEVKRKINVHNTLDRVKANADKPPSRDRSTQKEFEATLRFRRCKTIAPPSPQAPNKPLPHHRASMSPKKTMQSIRSMTKLISQPSMADSIMESSSKNLMIKSKDDGSCAKTETSAIFIQFLKSKMDIRQLLQAAMDEEVPITHFHDRPILSSAILEAGIPLPKRDPKTIPRMIRLITTLKLVLAPRPRYLMKENRTALPHQNPIFDDYVVPREVWDAVDAERSLQGMKVDTTRNFELISLDEIQMEAYYARTCPQDRDTISKALATLQIRGEKRVERTLTQTFLDADFQHENSDALLNEVQKLYEASSRAYHDFRQNLHKPLKIATLVDIALKCDLSDLSMTVSDSVVSTEASVEIPKSLIPPSFTVWRNSSTPPTTPSPHHRRRGIAEKRVTKRDLLDQLVHKSEIDNKLEQYWEFYDLSADTNHVFDPITLEPLLSVRFETVWRGLHMPTTKRFDLALKYSHPDYAHRLADAVVLWELCAHWINDREVTMERIKKMLKAADSNTPPTPHQLYDLVLALTTTTKKLKQSIALVHMEVGDFIAYEDDFYLNRIDSQHQHLHRELQTHPLWNDPPHTPQENQSPI
ncbi:hypothetical protein THRCLA_02594 [Thraustotheca clavata]|uniref:Uncharacterized protein n=1 Tax=Thraustotheca clavata TaxID=74557 RepID=A0A1W0A4L6_9STRA|nr:hypothetical protein THRCLA_02594 [Thraustotheca clavata]